MGLTEVQDEALRGQQGAAMAVEEEQQVEVAPVPDGAKAIK